MYLTDDRRIGYKLWCKGKVILLEADFAAKLFRKRNGTYISTQAAYYCDFEFLKVLTNLTNTKLKSFRLPIETLGIQFLTIYKLYNNNFIMACKSHFNIENLDKLKEEKNV